MYELTIERSFPATHAITIDGERETPHAHDWRVAVTVAGPRLDDEGVLCDFHRLERELDAVLDPFRDEDLNAVAAFTRRPPTAEYVAQHLADRLAASLRSAFRERVRVVAVSVTEAPGCVATYRPTDRPDEGV